MESDILSQVPDEPSAHVQAIGRDGMALTLDERQRHELRRTNPRLLLRLEHHGFYLPAIPSQPRTAAYRP